MRAGPWLPSLLSPFGGIVQGIAGRRGGFPGRPPADNDRDGPGPARVFESFTNSATIGGSGSARIQVDTNEGAVGIKAMPTAPFDTGDVSPRSDSSSTFALPVGGWTTPGPVRGRSPLRDRHGRRDPIRRDGGVAELDVR